MSIKVFQNICQTKTHVGKWCRADSPSKMWASFIFKNTTMYSWKHIPVSWERERGVHILLFLGYFFAQRNFDSWSFIDRIDLHPKKKMTTFFPIFSTFFVEKVLVGVYVFNNSLYRTIKGLLMAKKDSECLDQGQGCKFVFLTFG